MGEAGRVTNSSPSPTIRSVIECDKGKHTGNTRKSCSVVQGNLLVSERNDGGGVHMTREGTHSEPRGGGTAVRRGRLGCWEEEGLLHKE